MRVSILETIGNVYEGNAKEVILPAEGGELCIMDYHQPFLCSLVRGFIKIKEPKSTEQKRIPIKRGVARMRSTELIILVNKI